MDNQHRKISGYGELSQEEIDLMNEIKALGPQLEAVCNKVQSFLERQMGQAETDEVLTAMAMFEAFDWKSQGVMALKQGLMFLTRAIAKPSFF